MTQIAYTEFRQNLAKYLDEALDSHAPLVVTRQGSEPVVVLSLEEFEGLMETVHLLRSPANAARLLRSIEHAEAGQSVERGLDE